MIIRLKDSLKLLGIVIMCACAAVPCSLFVNVNIIDLARIKDLLTEPADLAIYQVAVDSGYAVVAITGGALALTTVVMLFFYIKQYISAHGHKLGVLKALGYSSFKIASGFSIFGLSVLLGTSIGFGIAFTLMPTVYAEHSKAFPFDIPLNFNPELILFVIIIPSVFFSVTAVAFAYFKLKKPALELVRDEKKIRVRRFQKANKNNKNLSFLEELRKSTVKSSRMLVFFIGFASFCYAAMMQMSLGMSEIASEIMGVLVLVIGLVLAFVTLFIAVSTVVAGNGKAVAMLKVFGYSDKECGKAILSGYRGAAAVGFVIGTGYQFGLMTGITNAFFDEAALKALNNSFNVPMFFVTLASFALVYEVFMRLFAVKMRKISLKTIMGETV